MLHRIIMKTSRQKLHLDFLTEPFRVEAVLDGCCTPFIFRAVVFSGGNRHLCLPHNSMWDVPPRCSPFQHKTGMPRMFTWSPLLDCEHVASSPRHTPFSVMLSAPFSLTDQQRYPRSTRAETSSTTECCVVLRQIPPQDDVDATAQGDTGVKSRTSLVRGTSKRDTDTAWCPKSGHLLFRGVRRQPALSANERDFQNFVLHQPCHRRPLSE